MSEAMGSLQSTLSEARETIEEYEYEDVPDALLPALDTKRTTKFQLRYFNGREISKELEIRVRPVKETSSYYRAKVDLEEKEDPELYLLKTDNLSDLEEELLDIPSIAYR